MISKLFNVKIKIIIFNDILKLMKVLRKIYFYKLFMKKSKNNSKNNNYLIIHFTKYFMKNLKNIKKVN